MDRIDLNADIGESFSVYVLGQDDALLRQVTSANVACGFHAGDPGTMARTVEAAVARGVGVGAHPGLPDLAGFGRRAMAVTPDEVRDLVTYQIGALTGFARRHGQRLQHVKPHGALYTLAEADMDVAQAIAESVAAFDRALILVGLSGGRLVAAGTASGLRVAHEVFADRAYQTDGTLTPRSQPGAVLHDLTEVAERVVRLAQTGMIMAGDGTVLTLKADTICLHGDTPDAPALAAAIRAALGAAGVDVRRLDAP